MKSSLLSTLSSLASTPSSRSTVRAIITWISASFITYYSGTETSNRIHLAPLVMVALIFVADVEFST